MRVMIVDDSVVFRSQIKLALEGIPSIEVVGTSQNGKIAISKLQQIPVDLMTLDLEMPEMNGIETLHEIRRLGLKTKVILFSSLTQRGAEAALEALRAGADDIVAKPKGDTLTMETAALAIRDELVPKILQFIPQTLLKREQMPLTDFIKPVEKEKQYLKTDISRFRPSVVVIGSSTGGPQALEAILRDLGPEVRCPILIAQHMPPVFTQCLAQRLSQISGTPAAEGKQMESLQPGKIYVAPGNYHMTVVSDERGPKIRLDQGPQVNSVRPAVDNLFESAAKVFGNRCLGIVLTGMGADGAVGAQRIKEAAGAVMIQNKESCAVFGMPSAVKDACAYDLLGDLETLRARLFSMVKS